MKIEENSPKRNSCVAENKTVPIYDYNIKIGYKEVRRPNEEE